MSDALNVTGQPGSLTDCCGSGISCDPPAEEAVSREAVSSYYAAAAASPQTALCCPTSYGADDVAHIPEDVLAISYGCGSPMAEAAPASGETVVDLGSGGGIDCFIAARHVGASGRVIGVDMTDAMLQKARANAGAVADNLGYQVVSFEKGYLEAIPVADGTANLVTSNCVINLSTDKPRVFTEIHRVLAPGGRFVISDIVCNREVPQAMRDDPELWGDCISGAMTEREFVVAAENAGFYGITLKRDYLWKEVNGLPFYSTTFTGWRFDKSETCNYQGQTALYLGPGRTFTDDDGHTYNRGEIVEVCTDTATKLARAPYAEMFVVTKPDNTTGGGCC